MADYKPATGKSLADIQRSNDAFYQDAPKFQVGQQTTLHHRVEGVGSAGDPVHIKAVNTSKGRIPGPKGFGAKVSRGTKFEEHRYEVHHPASGRTGHVYEEDLD